MAKLFYWLSAEEKAEITDHLMEIKFDGQFSDYLLNELKKNCINIKKMLLEGKWMAAPGVGLDIKKEVLNSIQITHDEKFQADGEKGVLVVGSLLLQGLEDWYRVNSYVNKEMGIMVKQVSSFEEFFQNFVAGKVNEALLAMYTKKLNEEKPEEPAVEKSS